MRRSYGRMGVAIGLALALCACQLIGPSSIGMGRDRYNSIIHSTAMEQMLSNIVRVYQNEPTMFMDVSEVDATLSFGGSLNGAATNIGAKATHSATAGTLSGELGSAGGTVSYSESPTIRYLPLLGQPLVAQLVTPVSVDALGLLYDSYWPAASVLDFSAAYLTLDYGEFFSALDTIIELDDRSAVQIAAATSGLPKPPQPPPQPRAQSPAGAGEPPRVANDSLVIYLRPFHRNREGDASAQQSQEDLWAKQRVLQLWVRLLRIYSGTQPAFTPRLPAARCTQIGLAVNRESGWFDPGELRKWDVDIRAKSDRELDEARDCLPRSIELRVVPGERVPPSKEGKKPEVVAANLVTGAPLMRTYSALGILKNAVERPHPRIEFVTAAQYQAIRNPTSHPWNADVNSLSYYTLLPEDEDSVDCTDPGEKQRGCDDPLPSPGPDRQRFLQSTKIIADWLRRNANDQASTNPSADQYPGDLFVYEKPGQDVLDSDAISLNRRFGWLRRYILIIVADAVPASAYASYFDRGRWYYIAGDDPVSQKNFHLLSLFTTMMAVPPATQPLSPVISVGG